jgi:hypothetical protein
VANVIHLGAWKIRTDAAPQAVDEVTRRVRAFKDQIAGVLVSYAGPFCYFALPQELASAYDVSPDVRWLARGYSHGLYMVFADESVRRSYDTAQPHLDLSSFLIPILDGGMGGVLNFDFVLTDHA